MRYQDRALQTACSKTHVVPSENGIDALQLQCTCSDSSCMFMSL